MASQHNLFLWRGECCLVVTSSPGYGVALKRIPGCGVVFNRLWWLLNTIYFLKVKLPGGASSPGYGVALSRNPGCGVVFNRLWWPLNTIYFSGEESAA